LSRTFSLSLNLGNNIYNADIIQKTSLDELEAIEKDEKAEFAVDVMLIGILVIAGIVVAIIAANELNKAYDKTTDY